MPVVLLIVAVAVPALRVSDVTVKLVGLYELNDGLLPLVRGFRMVSPITCPPEAGSAVMLLGVVATAPLERLIAHNRWTKCQSAPEIVLVGFEPLRNSCVLALRYRMSVDGSMAGVARIPNSGPTSDEFTSAFSLDPFGPFTPAGIVETPAVGTGLPAVVTRGSPICKKLSCHKMAPVLASRAYRLSCIVATSSTL